MADAWEADTSRRWWVMELGKDRTATVYAADDDRAAAEGHAARLNGAYDDSVDDARRDGVYERARWYFVIGNPYHHSVTRPPSGAGDLAN